jgi:hypothetical protein
MSDAVSCSHIVYVFEKGQVKHYSMLPGHALTIYSST